MLTQGIASSFDPVDVRTQRVLDSFVGQILGTVAVGLTSFVVHVAFTGDVGSLWAYGAAVLSFLVLVAVVHLVAWYAVQRASEVRALKRELVAAQLKALAERELMRRQSKPVTHG